MLSFRSLFITLGLFTFAIADLISVERFGGETTGRLIVQVRKGISSRKLIRSLGLKPTHDYEHINGFAGMLYYYTEIEYFLD